MELGKVVRKFGRTGKKRSAGMESTIGKKQVPVVRLSRKKRKNPKKLLGHVRRPWGQSKKGKDTASLPFYGKKARKERWKLQKQAPDSPRKTTAVPRGPLKQSGDVEQRKTAVTIKCQHLKGGRSKTKVVVKEKLSQTKVATLKEDTEVGRTRGKGEGVGDLRSVSEGGRNELPVRRSAHREKKGSYQIGETRRKRRGAEAASSWPIRMGGGHPLEIRTRGGS